MIRILLVEPDTTRRTRLSQALAADRGMNVVEAPDADGVAAIDLRGVDVAVSNTDLGPARGIELRNCLGAIGKVGRYIEVLPLHCLLSRHRHIPAGVIQVVYNGIPADEIVVHCLMGSRSAEACGFLSGRPGSELQR